MLPSTRTTLALALLALVVAALLPAAAASDLHADLGRLSCALRSAFKNGRRLAQAGEGCPFATPGEA